MDGAEVVPVDELLLVDIVPPRPELAVDRVTALVGDIETAQAEVDAADVVFHLAGVVSSDAEADLALGYRTNLDGMRAALDWCASRSTPPVLVFSSSLAVFGEDPAALGLVAVVDDTTMPRPQSSYGAQKHIGEVLVADYTRRGLVRGRTVRLMTVAVRPGSQTRPRRASCPGLSASRSPESARTSRSIRTCHRPVGAPPHGRPHPPGGGGRDDVGSTTAMNAMNLPAVTTTPREMFAALDQVAGEPRSDLVDHRPDPGVETVVGSWPARFVTDRAAALGFVAELDFGSIVAQYVEGSGV